MQSNGCNPTRVVFDSLSELRLLSQTSLRYRRQILAFKQYFAGQNCTTLFLDDGTRGRSGAHIQSLAHGVVALEQLAPEYGAERRRLLVRKIRGSTYRGGYHDFVIQTRRPPSVSAPGRGGTSSRFPEREHFQRHAQAWTTSSAAACPAERARFSSGPPGSGKSNLALTFATRGGPAR